jgi:aryl-alcohol dehydrogenase-like predicted oxidoreductase
VTQLEQNVAALAGPALSAAETAAIDAVLDSAG